MSYKKFVDRTAPHPLSLDLPRSHAVSADGLRRSSPTGTTLQSVSVSGAPMRTCFYCDKVGSHEVGLLFTALGRKQYAHRTCRETRLEQIRQRRADVGESALPEAA